VDTPPRTMRTMQNLARVHIGNSIMESEIVKARLEAEGVPAMLRGEGTGPYRMGPVEVWVPAEMELHARIVLEGDEARAAEPDPPEGS
jgi:hypothetical protein